jgi:AGCS family alanine or glycine:cation symporter
VDEKMAIFEYLDIFENFAWSYVGFPAIMAMGVYLGYISGLVQIRKIGVIFRHFLSIFRSDGGGGRGGPPIKTFFACIAGSVGIGNIVGITTAVQVGGPGALFWIWCVAIIGSVIKYAEVYLGMKTRIVVDGTYRGGPMYIFKKAFSGSKVFSGSWISKLFCVLMCLYGVEIYQFSVMTSSISHNFELSKPLVAAVLLGLVIFAELGGVKRIGTICSATIPVFIVIYLSMGLYVLISCIDVLPSVFVDVFRYACTPCAAVGGFAGSSIILAISSGMKRACYSSDIGVGYASIIHSESSVKNPVKQASLTIMEVFLDIFVICTMSIVLVLATGTWSMPGIDSLYLVQTSLSMYFPYMHYFMPFFLFLLGYNTIMTYFCAGMKAVEHLFPKRGRMLYYIYSATALLTFSFVDTSQAITVMSIVLVLLLILNLSAIWRLRKELSFDIASIEADVEKDKALVNA